MWSLYLQDAHTVYSKSDGTAWATGYNESGQLGDGSTLDKSSAVQVVDSNGDPLAGVVAISAANRHTVYLKSDGTVWSVGKNNYGQLGDGTIRQIVLSLYKSLKLMGLG